jgi:hypothetical protein
MNDKSILELIWNHYGGDKTEPRAFLDFVIDGQSLFRIFTERGFDAISCLGWGPASERAKAVARLLLTEPADLPCERRSLYVCHIDGDIACGAVTIKIENQGDTVAWRNFGFENNYDDEPLDLNTLSDVGPFIFDREQYASVMEQALERSEPSQASADLTF